jgi:hypothetical protein
MASKLDADIVEEVHRQLVALRGRHVVSTGRCRCSSSEQTSSFIGTTLGRGLLRQSDHLASRVSQRHGESCETWKGRGQRCGRRGEAEANGQRGIMEVHR